MWVWGWESVGVGIRTTCLVDLGHFSLVRPFCFFCCLPMATVSAKTKNQKKKRGQRRHTLAVSRSNCLASFSLAFCAAFASRSLAFIAAISCLVNPLYSSQSTRVSWCNSSFLYYGKKRKNMQYRHWSLTVFVHHCHHLKRPSVSLTFP